MKIALKDGRRYVLRFDKDEELMKALGDFAAAEKITAGHFSAVGTVSSIELGFFNSFIKEYRKKLILDNMEIVSLAGNFSVLENKPVIHAHGSFSNNEFVVVGGHVFKAVILATCEVFVLKMDGELKRGLDKNTNLNLFI